MKFLFPVALATFVAFASATNDCSVQESKVPSCAQSCVNAEAAKLCTPGDLECGCASETLEQIIEGSADCVAAACEGAGPVFPPLRTWCKCVLGDNTPTTTASATPTATPTTTPTATPTCAAEEAEVPTCAQECVNGQAAKLCTPGDLECGCASETLELIIEGSADCVAVACKGAGPVFPPLRNWCKCIRGDDSSTSSSSATPPKTSTSSAAPTTTDTSTTDGHSKSSTFTTVETSNTATTASQPVTLTSTIETTTVHTITSCAPTVTSCPGRLTTETITLTTTWCPEETQVSPTLTGGAPGAGGPLYPSRPAGTGGPAPSYVPSGTPVKPQPPAFTGAGAIAQHNSGFLAGIVAVVAGLAWL